MSTIRLLHVIDSLKAAGAERLLHNVVTHLDPARYDVHVFALSVLGGNPLTPEFQRHGVPVYTAGSRRFYNPGAAGALARYIREHRIDIVHTHLTSADVMGRVVARALGRPVVSTLHNELSDYARLRPDRRWLQRLTARHFTARLIAVSEIHREQFLRSWGYPPDLVTAIRTAIVMDPFLAVPEEPPARDPGAGPVFTAVGRLLPQKAHHILIEAARSVLEAHPGALFRIVGEGELADQLKAQAQSLGIADRVVFTGLRRDIPQVLAETDVFVMSSLWEGLPLAPIEAMAAARPVVLSDVGGLRDLVNSDAVGLLVPPGDVAALAQALLAVAADPARRLAMGRAARERVRHDFNVAVIVKQYEAVYEAVWAVRGRAQVAPGDGGALPEAQQKGRG